MRIMIPVEEKMVSEAEFGLFFMHYVITLKKAKELREMGFEVTDLNQQHSSPRLHKIAWNQAGFGVFDYKNIMELDETDPKYTLPQKLWLITSKVQRNPALYYKTH